MFCSEYLTVGQERYLENESYDCKCYIDDACNFLFKNFSSKYSFSSPWFVSSLYFIMKLSEYALALNDRR